MPGAASDPLSVGFGEMMRDVPLGDDASASTVACEGWLWKGGWLNPAFRRRFFTLRGSEISYMTDRESKQLRGKFNALSARPVVSTGRYRFSVQSDSGRVCARRTTRRAKPPRKPPPLAPPTPHPRVRRPA